MLEAHFVTARALNKAVWTRLAQRMRVAKRMTLAAALAGAFLQYYFLDVSVQIMAMRPAALAAYAGV